MRITFVVAALDFGGGMRVISQYAEGLRQLWHDVLVVSPAPYPYGRMARFLNSCFPTNIYRPGSHLDPTEVPVRLLERYRPILASDVPTADVIIATWWETAEWIASFPDDRGVKVHFVQDYEIWAGERKRVDASLMLPIKKITISKWLENILVKDLGCPSPILVSNGVDSSLFSMADRVMPEKPSVGFVHAPNPRKGSDIAISAISLARDHIPDLQAVAFGHGQLDQKTQLPKFIEYVTSPAQQDLRKIYGSCTAWLFPSREEGFGLPVLEALACGTPVIATPAGAAPEILERGGGAMLSGFHPGEMADEIIRMVRLNRSEWKRKSTLSLDIAKRYSVNNSISMFNDALTSLVTTNYLT